MEWYTVERMGDFPWIEARTTRRLFRFRTVCGVWQLYNKRDERIKDMSRGMRQLLGFLLTMLHQSEIILQDEPFTGLDPANMQMMKKKLRSLKEEGKLLMISTHILSFASDICDRVLFLDNGNITYETEKGTSFTEKELEQLFNVHIGSNRDSP